MKALFIGGPVDGHTREVEEWHDLIEIPHYKADSSFLIAKYHRRSFGERGEIFHIFVHEHTNRVFPLLIERYAQIPA